MATVSLGSTAARTDPWAIATRFSRYSDLTTAARRFIYNRRVISTDNKHVTNRQPAICQHVSLVSCWQDDSEPSQEHQYPNHIDQWIARQQQYSNFSSVTTTLDCRHWRAARSSMSTHACSLIQLTEFQWMLFSTRQRKAISQRFRCTTARRLGPPTVYHRAAVVVASPADWWRGRLVAWRRRADLDRVMSGSCLVLPRCVAPLNVAIRLAGITRIGPTRKRLAHLPTHPLARSFSLVQSKARW